MSDLEDLKKLNDIMTQFTYIASQNNKVPHYYLPEVKLYPTEIHLVEMIGAYEQMNITALASQYGCTKGAISKQVSKLQRKGLLEKRQLNGNKKEVWVGLTPLGEKAYQAHMRFHERQRSRYIEEYMTYSPEQKEFILRFLKLYSESLLEYDYEGNLSPEAEK